MGNQNEIHSSLEEKKISKDFHLDLHGGWRQGGDLFLHPVGDSRIHGGATGKDGVGVEIFANVDVALHDAVEAALVDADHLHAQESRAEHGLGAAETLVTDRHDLIGWNNGIFVLWISSETRQRNNVP